MQKKSIETEPDDEMAVRFSLSESVDFFCDFKKGGDDLLWQEH